MRPLVFLSVRSLVNSIHRALTSGKRMVTLIFAVVYYGWLVFRPVSDRAPMLPGSMPILTPDQTDAIVFLCFAFMSLILTVTLSKPKAGFRQADIDVLFATPISPRIVMFFRMARDYVWTLLTPFLFAVFGGQRSFVATKLFFEGMHTNSFLAVRLAMLAWFLMAMAWVSIGYGVGFLINRSDLDADRNKKYLDILLAITCVSTLLVVVVSITRDPELQTVATIAHSPFMRIVLFSATAACWMVMGTLNGQFVFVLLGTGILLAGIGIGIWLALTQLPFMYDQAAAKGFGSSERRLLMRNNDLYGLSAHKAREGKFKIGFISRKIGNMRVRGAAALVWKEVILQLRSSPYLYLLFGSILLMMLVPALTLKSDSRPERVLATGMAILITQAVGVLMLTMNSAVSGFIELLKRVDFQKPLPFRPAGTVFWEVAAKCIPNLIIATIASILVVMFRPVMWAYAGASIFLVLGLSLIVSSTVFLVTVAFPDAGDASQRSFRGILILLGSLICGIPGFGLLAVLMGYLHVSPILAILPATAINVGVAVIVSVFAGGLYAAYNPSE